MTKLHLLGRPSLHTGDKELAFISDLRYQLLSYLAYVSDWISRDKLADLLWSHTTDMARQNLRQLLRRVQDFEWLSGLEVERTRVRWLVSTDVMAFRQALQNRDADEALNLYKGALLENLDSYDDTEFETWLQQERESLHSAWRELVLERADTYLQTKRAEDAATLLRSLLKRDDLDEQAVALYLEAARGAGLKHQALRLYQDFRRRLRKEVGLEPSTVTTQLAEVLEKGEDATPQAPRPTTFFFPTVPTSFIGRGAELAEAARLLSQQDCRLLTLTGPGGVGKTRLSLETARAVSSRYTDGVSFVSLASVTTPEAIVSSIAAALELTLQGQDDPLKQVQNFIAEKTMLLVLDNFEQLLSGATLLSDLLQRCKYLNLLVTSRERLNLVEEWMLAVGGLTLAPDTVTTNEVSNYHAPALFLERAKRVRPAFEVTNEDLPSVIKICKLVQGLPLGLELAAVWVRAMSCEEIALEIEASLDFLSSSAQNVDERHASLRATFEYSWKLLTEKEKDVLKKLSVFQGGISREAATIVASANGALLAALVDKSLLYIVAKSRYDFHPLVAQYAKEKLLESSEEAQTNAKHTLFSLNFVEPAERELRGASQDVWLKRLESEHDNLRVALRWTKTNGDTDKHLHLLLGLWRFWWVRGYLSEGRKLLVEGLAQKDGSDHLRRRVFNCAGTLAWAQGDFPNARVLFEEGLRLARAAHDEPVIASLLTNLALVDQEQGNIPEARLLYEESIALYRALGEKRGLASPLGGLGLIAWQQGDFVRARALLEESHLIVRDLGDGATTAIALNNLGLVVCDQGDYTLARTLLHESLVLRWKLADKWGLASSFATLACLAFAESEQTRATHLWAAAEVLRDELATPVLGIYQTRYERDVRNARINLGDHAFTTAWEKGRALSLEKAVAYALDEGGLFDNTQAKTVTG